MIDKKKSDARNSRADNAENNSINAQGSSREKLQAGAVGPEPETLTKPTKSSKGKSKKTDKNKKKTTTQVTQIIANLFQQAPSDNKGDNKVESNRSDDLILPLDDNSGLTQTVTSLAQAPTGSLEQLRNISTTPDSDVQAQRGSEEDLRWVTMKSMILIYHFMV